MKKTSAVAGDFGSYDSALQHVKQNHPKRFIEGLFRIQQASEAHMHPWQLIIYPTSGKFFY